MIFGLPSLLITLLWHSLLSAALAVPQASNHTNQLLPRQCWWDAEQDKYVCDDRLPTVADMLFRMHNTLQGGRVDSLHSAVFYTGLDGMGERQEPWLMAWLEGNDIEFYWLYNAVPFGEDDWWLTQYNFVKDNFEKPEYQELWGEDGLDTFTSCYYEALAVGALHPDAYVFTPKDHEWDPSSLFRDVELPYLTHNPNIQRIWRVDPRPRFEGGKGCGTLKDRELYWDRARGDAPIDIEWICPEDPPLESMWPSSSAR